MRPIPSGMFGKITTLLFKKVVIGAVLAFVCAAVPAHAQKTKAQINTEITGQFPDNTINGITPQNLRNVTGDIINSIMPTAPVNSGNQVCFNGTTGLLQDCGAPPILSIVSPLQLVAGALSCPTCQTSSAGANVIASRTLATSLNLSAFSAIKTLGYGSPGDGGGATFKNVGSAPFIDSNVNSTTIVGAGASCTNGTYYGVSPTGGTGSKLQGNVTIAGNVMTAFSTTGTGGNAYTVNDVLTVAGIPGCSPAPTIKVVGVTSPIGSLIDNVGTHFQIVPDAGNIINVKQFSARMDYLAASGDAAATDDGPAIQNALRYAGYGLGSGDAGGFAGTTIFIPQGAAKVCHGLQIPSGVVLTGAGNSATTLKQCDADSATTNFITLGDPQNHQTAFFLGVWNMTLFAGSGGSGGGATMVYSNSAQSFDAIHNVSIYPIYRSCAFTETGYGGPSMFHIYGMYCVPNDTSTPSPAVSLSAASNNLIDGGTWFSSGGSPWSGTAISVPSNVAGVVNEFDDIHCENLATCFNINVAAGRQGCP